MPRIVRALVISRNPETLKTVRVHSQSDVPRNYGQLPTVSTHLCWVRRVTSVVPFRVQKVGKEKHRVGVCSHCDLKIILR